MKNKLSIILPLIFIVTTIILYIGGCDGKDSGKLKIGADYTLTGNLSFWSTELKKGMDFAISKYDTLNKIEIIYEDNTGKASDAVNIFKKFATVDKVNVVMSCFTPIGQPLRDLAKNYQIPFIATVTSAEDFAAINEWTFRDFPTQDQQATALANFVYNNLKLRKGSFLVVNDDYGKDGAKIFKKVFNELGGNFYDGDYFTQTDKSMRNQIEKVLQNNPEFLLIIGRDQALSLVCRQIREVNKDVKIVGVNAFDASIVWELLGDAGEGIIFTSAYIDYSANPEAKKFKDDYFNKFNEEPNYVVVYGYTIAKYLIDILYQTGPDNAQIKERLHKLDVNSIRGKLKTNDVRDVTSPIGIYKREQNQTILFEKSEE